jgi:hypothetical protein
MRIWWVGSACIKKKKKKARWHFSVLVTHKFLWLAGLMPCKQVEELASLPPHAKRAASREKGNGQVLVRFGARAWVSLPGEPSWKATQGQVRHVHLHFFPSPQQPVIQVGKGLGPPRRFLVLFLRLQASC